MIVPMHVCKNKGHSKRGQMFPHIPHIINIIGTINPYNICMHGLIATATSQTKCLRSECLLSNEFTSLFFH